MHRKTKPGGELGGGSGMLLAAILVGAIVIVTIVLTAGATGEVADSMHDALDVVASLAAPSA